MGHKQGTYTMRFRSQFTDQRLFGTEQFSIGGRYSVRGALVEERNLKRFWLVMYKMNGHYHLRNKSPYA